ncbi:amidohydrolase family protein [Marinobacter salexigens]|uniref:Amidohydrolase family protein n=1 Tax=Marinobacter salexigens TaxID=1925763 RepID=A0ABS6AC97_9GAMM|nr:amidohydrolase family protein [Marinobacter salexigens]MBU2874868.1 amidohydrolase family protein [Marinobacter salexigens]
MLDMLVRNVNLPDGRKGFDIAIKGGKIVEVSTQIQGQALKEIDGRGHLASPPFVDSHFHMDSALSLGQPRLNQSGTLLEGIEIWSELKPQLTVDAIKQRALEMCRWAIARGTLAIRSHVDICDDRLLAVEALLDVRQQMKPYIDLQLVAFPQDGYLRYRGSLNNMQRALDKGLDVIGGIPHFERTKSEGSKSIKMLCELAANRGLLVDMHCDESDDPMSRHVETLAFETNRLGLHGRVCGSHLTSMHSMDNYYVSNLIPLMREADLNVVANPLINITLQGRHDSYPMRRGMTRVKELMEAGMNVAFGHDCVMDPWYSLGSHDMLDVAHMGLHVGQMTGVEQMNQCFQAITSNGAKTLQLDGYGLEPGCNADIVILQASSAVEAIRLRPERLFVIRRGEVVATTEPATTSLLIGEHSDPVNFSRNLF